MVSGQKGGSRCKSTGRGRHSKPVYDLRSSQGSLNKSVIAKEESQVTIVDDEDRIEIQFDNEGLPIGKASVGLSTFMGDLVREVVPFTISDWRKLPPEMIEDLWKRIQAVYKINEEWQKGCIFKQMGALWRSSKSRLVSQVRKASSEEERLELRPDNIKSIQDWNDFVKEKTSEQFKAKSEKFKELKRRQLPHTCSRRGYARVTDDLRKSSPNPSSISKGDVWAQAHTKKNGEPINAVAAATIAKLRQAESDPSSSSTKRKEDALLKVLDPNKRGQVKLIRKLPRKQYRKRLRLQYQPETNLTEANREEQETEQVYEEEEGDEELEDNGQFDEYGDDEDDPEEFEDEDGKANEEHGVEAAIDWKGEQTDLVRSSRENSVTITLANADVLNCCICFQPLTIPVFQCENAHLACSPCCTKVMGKCPSCHSPISNTRCITIERVLESARVRCKNANYGCEEVLSYSKIYDHEKTCPHAPCSCPVADCYFHGSFCLLYRHFKAEHKNSAVSFVYDSLLNINLNVNEKFLILQEERDGVLFILNNRFTEHVGNVISVNCISDPDRGVFGYNIIARFPGSDLRFQSFTKSIRNLDVIPPLMGSLLVPSDCFDSRGNLQLDLCVWRPGISSAYV